LKVQKAIADSKRKVIQRQLTPQEALALVLELNLTKNQYTIMRKTAMNAGHQLYPPYSQVQLAKQDTRPSLSAINVTETKAEVRLQDLLAHTSNRVVKLCQEGIVSYMDTENFQHTDVVLLLSWGMDGSSGQAKYKQRASLPSNMVDSTLFATTAIPLRLTSSNKLLWQNPCPQSPSFCRPIRIQFVKETKELVLAEKQKVEQEL